MFLFNILERKFILFGKVFWPQDLYLFAIAAIVLIIFITLFTVVYGRLFCGWVCPQTIFMEMVFRRIEYWIEGDWTHQKKLKSMPWNREKIIKKTSKHLIFWGISFLIANTFLAYIIGSDEPMGWDYQIENQIVFNLGYQGHRLISRHNTEPSNSGLSQYDFSGVGRINAGNYQSELAIGSVARWGNNLAHNFGTTGFSPGKFVDIGMLSSSPTGYFLFTGIEGRYRINDITIEGDRPSEVPDSNVEHLQATAVIGGIYYQHKWGVSLSFAITTPEFKEDKHSSSSIGSLEVFWRL